MKMTNEGLPKGVMGGYTKCPDPASCDKGNGANNAAPKAKSIKPFKR